MPTKTASAVESLPEPAVGTDLATHIHQSMCPACGHHVAVDFFDGGRQPLATLGWPKSEEDAREMTPLPLDFVRCVSCGHVYNRSFRYEDVPYSDHPNLMYNQSKHWAEHLAHVRDLVLDHAPPSPRIVEIGCGTGHLLSALAQANPSGQYIGFDPNAGSADLAPGVVTHQALFDPVTHLPQIRPHVVVSRHVLEHLVNPLGFIQRLSFAAEWFGLETKLYLEVPCIDPVFKGRRTNDFYYEHNSHFTVESFTRMLDRCVSRVHCVRTAYGDEVVYGVATVGVEGERTRIASEAIAFAADTRRKLGNVREQLDRLLEQERQIALWGGTGKSAAFINHFGLDAGRFPIVVDSDPDKLGSYVPGSGQLIRHPEYLRQHHAQVILITTQWRAHDIVTEITDRCIPFEMILVEHGDRLVDYHRDEHPYKLKREASDAHAGDSVSGAGSGRAISSRR